MVGIVVVTWLDPRLRGGDVHMTNRAASQAVWKSSHVAVSYNQPRA